MNDYFWMREPVLRQMQLPRRMGTNFYVQGLRNDGQMFFMSAFVSEMDSILLRSEEQQRAMLEEVMKQLAKGMESYLDPECICRVGQTEECPVRHPRKNEE